jgi:hypothetical protein
VQVPERDVMGTGNQARTQSVVAQSLSDEILHSRDEIRLGRQVLGKFVGNGGGNQVDEDGPESRRVRNQVPVSISDDPGQELRCQCPDTMATAQTSGDDRFDGSRRQWKQCLGYQHHQLRNRADIRQPFVSWSTGIMKHQMFAGKQQNVLPSAQLWNQSGPEHRTRHGGRKHMHTDPSDIQCLYHSGTRIDVIANYFHRYRTNDAPKEL